jgi:hypothetical protein
MKRSIFAVAAVATLSLGLASAMAAEPKKHGTTPGDKYEPSLNVLGSQPVDQPGTKPGEKPL